MYFPPHLCTISRDHTQSRQLLYPMVQRLPVPSLAHTWSAPDKCKGTSVHFLTSPILSHLLPVHMYFPSSPLYYLQGPYL
jgi:hypothetical protein